LIKPTALAKTLGIQPQRIYGLLKQGKVKDYAAEGTAMVDEAEVRRALAATGRRAAKSGGIKGGTPGRKASVKKGDFVAWQGSKNKMTIGQVRDTDEILTNLNIQKGDVYPWKTESLLSKVESGQLAILNLEDVERFVLAAKSANGQ
jgi:hypothetical protein